MEGSMTFGAVTEVQAGTGSNEGQAPAVVGLTDDWNADMAKMSQAEPAQPESQPQAAVTQPTTPSPVQQPAPQAITPVAAPAVPEIPEKFKAPNGELDKEKLLKSYGEAERELKRLQNARTAPQAPQSQATAQPVAQPQAQSTPLTQFEAQVAQDLFQEASKSGSPISEGQAIAFARVQVRLYEAASKQSQAATFGEVAQFRETLAEQARRNELDALAKNYPEVLTPQGLKALTDARTENPWLNQSPEPWKAAALFLLGQRSLYQTAPSQVNPTPQASQNTAPPIPANPGQVFAPAVQLDTPEQIDAYVKTLTPQQEDEFWKKAGFSKGLGISKQLKA